MIKTKKHYEQVNTVISQETGEIVELRRTFTKQTEKEKFVMFYLNAMSGLFDIASKSELRIVAEIWQIAEWDTNKVVLIKHVKQEIASKLDFSYQTVQNAISNLSKKKILIRKATGLYYLNPEYFFMGSELAKADAVKIIFDIKFK